MARKKGRKKRSPSFFVALAAFFVAGALFLGTFLYLASLERTCQQPPPFEESTAPSSLLGRQIAAMDQAIYRCLKTAGIPQKNIAFLEIKPKRANRTRWEFAAILIRLPRQGLIASLQRELTKALSEQTHAVRIQTERGARNGMVFNLYAGEHYTHRIMVVPDGVAFEDSKILPRIAIIIDDLGHDFGLAKSFMALDFPVSIAVLPRAPATKRIVETAQQRKREILLHLPMESEAHSHLEAGAGALLTSMDEKEIVTLFEEHLSRVPGAVGVNNHMGSRFTRSEPHMATLMGELKRRGLFYLDSRTTPETVSMEIAAKAGVAAAERSVFLDNELKQEAMAFQLKRLLAMGRHSGKAVGIGHPHPETLRFLKGHAELLKGAARVVPVSRLVQ